MSKNARFYYWLFKSFFAKHKMVILPMAILGMLIFSQIPTIFRLMPTPKPTTYIGRVGNYTLSNLPRNIQLKMSQGLTAVDKTGKPIPALAAEWKIIDDGTTYIFTLDENAQWQDGTPVTAYDVDYTINDVETEVLDEKTVVFKLDEPFAPFPSILSQPLFKRKQISYLHVVDMTKIVGTGEYHLSKIKFNGTFLDHIILESDKEKIVYRFYNTERAAIMAFQLAEIDIIEEISDPGELSAWPNLNISNELSMRQYAVVYFNVNDANLAEKKIRQALTYMIPKREDAEIRALGPISPNSWAYNPSVKPYSYSFESAQTLMEGLKTDFEIELTTTPNFYSLAEQIKGSWEQLGPTVRIKVVNLPDTNNYQALLIGQQVPQDPDQYMLWHSTQEGNITGYESPKIDKLLEDGRKELDEENRKDIYLDFQRFLVEDSPAAFIHYLETYTVSRS